MTALPIDILRRREAIHRPRRPRRAPLSALLGTIRVVWRRRQSRILLSQLDDSMLRDIGVTRSEAQLEANKPFWRE